MSKHTPEPWECIKYPRVFSITAVGRQIAIMTEHHGDCPMVPISQFERSERDAADARLITAAPKLLRVLKATMELMRTLDPPESDIAKVFLAAGLKNLETIVTDIEG